MDPMPNPVALDSIRSKYRTVTLMMNSRCPLRCRHCNVRAHPEHTNDDQRIRIDDLVRIIEAIDPLVYSYVVLAGGEPSLDPQILKVAITASKTKGLRSAMVTAPIWAPNASAAERFLDLVTGLDTVALSYDRYHLEFLTVTHYETAVRAAASRDVPVTLHICYSDEAEIPELLDRMASVRHLFRVSTMRTVPIGDEAGSSSIAMGGIAIEDAGDLKRIPRNCVLGNIFIDHKTCTVYSCCLSRSARRSPFCTLSQLPELKTTLNNLENDQLFQTVRARGFLDALTPNGQAALVQLLKGRVFANECHICLTAMNDGGSEIWEETGHRNV